jgi:hypothetical protein
MTGLLKDSGFGCIGSCEQCGCNEFMISEQGVVCRLCGRVQPAGEVVIHKIDKPYFSGEPKDSDK